MAPPIVPTAVMPSPTGPSQAAAPKAGATLSPPPTAVVAEKIALPVSCWVPMPKPERTALTPSSTAETPPIRSPALARPADLADRGILVDRAEADQQLAVLLRKTGRRGQQRDAVLRVGRIALELV